MGEAQLIGRGARYFPFQLDEIQDRYKRKFDEDAENELRAIEALYYHSAHNPKYIDEIENDEYIGALIVEIDSYGGYPVASEEITNALKRMKTPVIALIRESAASGAYLIATGADKIYASEASDVGSIGVTMSYLDYSEQNKDQGIIYQQLSSGKFKDSGDPDKELTEEEEDEQKN